MPVSDRDMTTSEERLSSHEKSGSITLAPADARALRRVVRASVVGTALEAYDLFLYGTAAALVFGPLFFSGTDPTATTLLALSSFAVSFVGRPLGAIVFGHLGDRLGRQRTLVLTLLMMGTSTFLIGLLPTYATIGVAAPVILTVLRFTQGFGYGGEYTGGVLMLAEHAPNHRRGFYAGLNNAAPVAGFVLSSLFFLLMSSILSSAEFLSWGWRVPFVFSIVLVGVGLYVRRQVAESPLFLEAESAREALRRPPLLEVLTQHPRAVLLVAGANVSQFATFYLIATFSLSYGSTELGIDRNSILLALVIAVSSNAVTIPAAALASDEFGRRPVLIVGSVAMIIWAFPFFVLFDTGRFELMVLALTGGMLGYGIVYGAIAAFSAEVFETTVRYTGSAVGYNLGGIVGGAFAPIVATLLFSTFESTVPISLYLIAVALISLAFIARARETSTTTLA